MITIIDSLQTAQDICAEIENCIVPDRHKKAASNLRQVDKVFSQLEGIQDKTDLRFGNKMAARCVTQIIKLLPLILHDLGEDCPRSLVKSYSQWASKTAFEMSPHGEEMILSHRRAPTDS